MATVNSSQNDHSLPLGWWGKDNYSNSNSDSISEWLFEGRFGRLSPAFESFDEGRIEHELKFWGDE